MKQLFTGETKTQAQKANEDGYLSMFVFSNGEVYCQMNPARKYLIITVEKKPCPCPISRTIVYRIQTPDGLKGIVVLGFFEEGNESFDNL